MEAEQLLGSTLVAKASGLHSIKRYDAAMRYFTDGQELGRELYPDEKIEFAQTLAHVGDLSQAAAATATVEPQVQDQPFLLSELVICYALLATQSSADDAQRHREKAIELLESIAELGMLARPDIQQRYRDAWQQGVFGEHEAFAAWRKRMVGE